MQLCLRFRKPRLALPMMAKPHSREKHVFLIGPGGVGKTTVGPLLAPLIDATFIDLDEQFCERIAPIRRFLDDHGYSAYIRENASLLRTLLKETKPASRTVFALSSGFLVTNVEAEVVSQNRALVMQQGTAVLLMPSEDITECIRVIVERQLHRGLGLVRESQEATATQRIGPYLELGHVKIYASGLPSAIALDAARRIQSHWSS